MIYRKCPYCGAALDPGEICDCAEAREKEKAHQPEANGPGCWDNNSTTDNCMVSQGPVNVKEESEMNTREDPVIQNLQRTGWPDGKEPEHPRCPVCGEECDMIYRHDGDIVGCDNCIEESDAWETDECFPEPEELAPWQE